ncbi:hypothetical protein JCM11641_006208 [Rhodosporidiobolus odoratus]
MATASNEMTEHAEAEGAKQYKPSEHDGLRKDGKPDQRMSSEHGFGGNKELASEAGQKGGKAGVEEFAHGHEAVGPEEK